MQLIGLTGGIGSGKTTVSTQLSEHGFLVVDADAITRALQEPDQEVYRAIIEYFGIEITHSSGALDRQALANRVFSDPIELQALNQIVHPAVGKEIATRISDATLAGIPLAILDIPLLIESGRNDLALTIVVDTAPDLAVDRLVHYRGFSLHDAQARIAAQTDRATRLAHADIVIDNNGSREELTEQVKRLVHRLNSLSDRNSHTGCSVQR